MPAMLPIRDLLNPVTPESSDASSDEASVLQSPTQTAPSSAPARHLARPQEWPSKQGKQRGQVHFMPFEEGLSPEMLHEITLFQVRPFGHIRQSCEHIPYNSSKKDFFEKTGRESIDVMKYEFTPRGKQHDFTVMWDYDVGLVRITPFFKCLGYAKTKPSQMLDKNPGLRDITPSITGGAVSAQGYWMPYKCARAVCATFCHAIAPALVPLFGPSFPSECRQSGDPGYRDMVIDPRIIEEATCDALAARTQRTQPRAPLAPRHLHEPRQHHHVLEPRPDQHSYERMPSVPVRQRGGLIQASPQHAPPAWKAINTAPSPITPPRSSNSQRALISGNTDSFRDHQYVEEPQRGMVLLADEYPEPNHPYQRDRAGCEEYPMTPVAAPLVPPMDGYNLARRYTLPPVIVHLGGMPGDGAVKPLPLQGRNKRKRGNRRMEDYHAANALVGLHGEAPVRTSG